MESRPWQITIRGVLLAMFWLGVALAAFMAVYRADPRQLAWPLALAIMAFCPVSIFAAGGALLGRAKLAALIAACLWLILMALTLTLSIPWIP